VALQEMVRYSEENLRMQCSVLIEARSQSEILKRVKEIVDNARYVEVCKSVG